MEYPSCYIPERNAIISKESDLIVETNNITSSTKSRAVRAHARMD